MWRQKLCLGVNTQFEATAERQIRMIREAGFDEIFLSDTQDGKLTDDILSAKRLGIPVQSVHAPFGGCAALWEENEEKARTELQILTDCLHTCANYDVPIMVSHTYIGFNKPPLPKERGLERFGTLIREAERCGVRIAFENTEGEAYLDALLRTFGNSPAVGFCWDSGHEMCYNHNRDLLKDYGDLLIATHLNDNLGIKDFGGEITYLDDLHLLPFDGIADWTHNAARLKAAGSQITLTFELNKKSKPGRHENDCYDRMPLEVYLAEAFQRACKFAAIFLKSDCNSK